MNNFQNGLILLYKLSSLEELYKRLNSKWFNNKVPDEYTDMTGEFNLLSLTRSEFEKLISKVIGESNFNSIIENLIKNNYIKSLYYPNIIYRKYIAQLILTDTEYKANKIDILAFGQYFNIQFIELTDTNVTCTQTTNETDLKDDTLIFFLYKNKDGYYENFKLSINDKNIILTKNITLKNIQDIRKGATNQSGAKQFDIAKLCKFKNFNNPSFDF